MTAVTETRRRILPAPPRSASPAVPAPLMQAPAAVHVSLETFIGTPSVLTETDFVKAAEMIGCDVAAIRAVHEVESAGRGFRKSGVPTIRFEPHVFSRETDGRFNSHRVSEPDYSKAQRIANSTSAETLLIEAAKLDYQAAIRSTSWGLGQVMAFNFALAGCDSVDQFVAEAKSGEAAQLVHMVRFIQNARLDGHLRACDWARFARGYNGSSYKSNDYDGKLARSYARHAGSPSWTVTDLGDSGPQVKRLQEALKTAGYPCNDDGHFGPETEAALRAFQEDYRLSVDGMAGARTWEALRDVAKVQKTKETAPPPPEKQDDVLDEMLKTGRDIGSTGGTFGVAWTEPPFQWIAAGVLALGLISGAIHLIRRALKK